MSDVVIIFFGLALYAAGLAIIGSWAGPGLCPFGGVLAGVGLSWRYIR